MHYFLRLQRVGFYVSSLRPDEPAIVVRRGSVLDATDAARARGVDRDAPLSTARSLCPEARVIEWRTEDFDESARAWMMTLTDYSGAIERVDQHIAFVDLSDHIRAESIARMIVSAFPDAKYGVGPSRWIAELASQAPATTSLEDVERLTPNFPTSMLFPVAPESRERLTFLGYPTIGSIQSAPAAALRAQFGREAITIEKACRGRLFQPIHPNFPGPSLSRRANVEGGTEDVNVLHLTLARLASELGTALVEDDRRASHAVLAFEFEDGTFQRVERALAKPAFSYASCLSPFRVMARAVRPGLIVGVRATLLDLERNERIQRTLQSRVDPVRRDVGVAAAIRDIHQSMGSAGIVLGSEMKTSRRTLARKRWEHALGLDG